LDSQKKARVGAILIGIGFVGLTISIIGLIGSLFLVLILAGLAVFLDISLKKIKQAGLISFLPLSLRRLMLNWSIYDILCELFYFRTSSILIANIILPFLKCSSPEEAKEVLDCMKDNALGPRVHGILFQKGLVNNFSDKVKKVMLPEDKVALQKLTRNVKTYNKLNEKIDLRLLKSGKALLNNSATEESFRTPSQRGGSHRG